MLPLFCEGRRKSCSSPHLVLLGRSLGNLSSFRPVEPGDGRESTGDGSKNKSTRDDAPQQVPQGWGDSGSFCGWDERASQGGSRTNQEGGLKLLGLANLGAAVRKEARLSEREKVGQFLCSKKKTWDRKQRGGPAGSHRTLFSVCACSACVVSSSSGCPRCSHDVPHDGGLPSRADSCEAKGEKAQRGDLRSQSDASRQVGRVADLRGFVSHTMCARVFGFLTRFTASVLLPRAFER